MARVLFWGHGRKCDWWNILSCIILVIALWLLRSNGTLLFSHLYHGSLYIVALYLTAYLKHVQMKRQVKFCVLILKEYLKAYFSRLQNRPTYISKNFNNFKHLAFVKTGTRDIYIGRSTLKVLSSDHDWFEKRSIEIFKYWNSSWFL